MTWVDDAVQDFGRGMGMDGLAFTETGGTDARGVIHLHIGRMGELVLERRAATVSVCLARPLPHPTARQLATALELCDFRAGPAMPTAAGLRGDDVLVFVTRMPHADVTLPALQQAVERLITLHDRVAS